MTQEGEDCYFYYYSTCKKGSICPYRHEPSSRGTEAICEDWEFGRCLKEHCPLRHMRIQVNRSAIPCYWELQPAGCQKPHCVFRHRQVRKTTIPIDSMEPKLAKSNSPKVEQILIHMADTDEESPQKTVQIKSQVNEHDGTQVSLRYTDATRSNTTGRREEQSVKDESDILEDELKEFAKKGINIDPVSVMAKPAGSSALQVKVKTLKEIKREKVLKARLEYERKKLLASQQQIGSSGVQQSSDKVEYPASQDNSNLVDKKGADSEKTSPQCHTTKENGSRKSAPKRRLSRRDLSAAVEVSNSKSADAEEVRVKSFSEIMEEKRRRLHKSNAAGEGHAKLSQPDVAQKPIITPKKLKIPSGVNKKPIRLKRAPPCYPQGESQAKIKSNRVEPRSLSLEHSENHQQEPPVSNSSPMSLPAKRLSVEPQSTDDVGSKRSSIDDRCNLDSDDELDLLGSSGYLKGDATQTASDDVSDEEFMNEMEQLLA
ncbi:zinc finger CCCH domain-containing protein 11A-like [Watersipora subatra]|uniref:zinc finger CCCH domain-containing protein 11A-like n=1 Tax=Watersipora subatra TaxID=2589382 RepID=UPI00355BD12F